MVVVLEPTKCLIAESIDNDTAMTVLALVSEDPSSWEEAASVWPLYCSSAVCEFASGIPFAETERDLAIEALSGLHAWEAQQREYEEFSDQMDRKQAERSQAEREQTEASDPFETAWSGLHHDRAIPGDRGGYLKMAFMIGEIVSDLQRLEAEQEEIKTLNEAFANYRRSEGSLSSGEHLKQFLQTLSERYPDLISKAADMQSRIDEATRPVACDDSDLGFPF